jgi:hypothetical protein
MTHSFEHYTVNEATQRSPNLLPVSGELNMKVITITIFSLEAAIVRTERLETQEPDILRREVYLTPKISVIDGGSISIKQATVWSVTPNNSLNGLSTQAFQTMSSFFFV